MTVEKCQEEFVKDCRIEFMPDAQNLTQMICRKPLAVDNCNFNEERDDQNVICVTRYETECINGHPFSQVLCLISHVTCNNNENSIRI